MKKSRLQIKKVILVMIGLALIASIVYVLFLNTNLGKSNSDFSKINSQLKTELDKVNVQLTTLQNEDQVKKNIALQTEIKNIHDTYTKATSVYESLTDFENSSKDIKTIDKLTTLFAQSLSDLSKQNYVSSSATLDQISSTITAANAAAVVAAVPENVQVTTTPPVSGTFSTQQVMTPNGTFLVSIIAGDLSSTKVIVDTASDSDCGNNCPVLPLATYVGRSGAYAGVNGSYFCPADYPSCAGKSGTFDLLVMNKNKHYFNSDNNVYSNNPAVIFGGSYVRFVGQASQWGRDTGIDSMLSNYPMEVQGGNIAFSGNGDPKMSSKSTRGFVANKGNTVYIGIIYGASVADAAQALKAMGMENALNLDDGGSQALWYGGYKAGPGRNIPNAILFVKK